MLDFYYHPLSLYCVKVKWFLEEYLISHRAIPVDLTSPVHEASFGLGLAPTAKVPFIVSDDFRLAESNAILRYLCDRYGVFSAYPVNLEARAGIDQWMDYLTQHIAEPISDLIWYRGWAPRFGQPRKLDLEERALHIFERNISRVEQHLSQSSKFFMGPTPSLPDFVFAPFAVTAPKADIDLERYPAISRWRKEMLSLKSAAPIMAGLTLA